MTSPPDPRRRLTSDELIATVVAFLGIGSIFFWAITQKEAGFDLGALTGTSSPTPQATLPNPTAPQTATGIIAPIIADGTTSPAPSPSVDPNVAPTPTQGSVAPQSPAPTVSPSPNPTLPNLVPAPTGSVPTAPARQFSDVPNDFWAAGYIAELSRRNILNGFPDGTFQPNRPITRAEFAGVVGRAFEKPKVRQNLSFNDLPQDYWAKSAIDESVQTGFLNGYPGGVFQPDQQIPLIQLQSALVNGLSLKAQQPANQVLARFEDANEVPKWAQDKAAAAVESGLVTGFPSAQKLTPNRVATRADAAAIVYQALVREGRVSPAPVKR